MKNFWGKNLIFLIVIFGILTVQKFVFNSVNRYTIVFVNLVFYFQIVYFTWKFSKSKCLEIFTKEKWLAFSASYLCTAVLVINIFINFCSYELRRDLNTIILIVTLVYIIIKLKNILKFLKEFQYYRCVINDSILLFIPVFIILLGFIPTYVGMKLNAIHNQFNFYLSNIMMLTLIFIAILSFVTSLYSKAQIRVNFYLICYIIIKLSVYYILNRNSNLESNHIYIFINFIDTIFFMFLTSFASRDRKRFSTNINHIQDSDYDEIINIIIFSVYLIFSLLSIFIFNILNTKENIIRYIILNILTINVFLVRIFSSNKSKKRNIAAILAQEKFNKITNIYSRFEFKDRVESLFGKHTLFIIDISNFNLINEVYGRKIGDKTLYEFGEKLAEICKRCKSKTIYGSYGADEFLFAIKSIKREEINWVLSQLNNINNLYIHELDKSLKININIGYSLNNNKKTFDDMLEEAAFAKKKAKKEIFLNSIEYSEKLDKDRSKHKIIKRDIISALRNNELYTVYQPQISLKSNKIIGYETLIRWNHNTLGYIGADDIINTLEELELINELDIYVFEKACSFQTELIKNDINIQCSINISVNTLKNRDIVYILDKIAKKFNLNPNNITIEILEDFDLEANGTAANQIVKLKKYGFKISVDDFGKGYSSINRLLKIPFDQIKIPREFVDDIANEKYISMISSIAKFASWLGAELVVEGVESKEHYDFFKLLEFDIIQGFYFSKGLEESGFVEYAKKLGI